jgi:hypothetical protein
LKSQTQMMNSSLVLTELIYHPTLDQTTSLVMDLEAQQSSVCRQQANIAIHPKEDPIQLTIQPTFRLQ